MLTTTERRIFNDLHKLTTQDSFFVDSYTKGVITRADFEAIADGNTLDDILMCDADMEWVAGRLAKVLLNKIVESKEDKGDPLPSDEQLTVMAEKTEKMMRNPAKKYANDPFFYVLRDFEVSMNSHPQNGLFRILKSEIGRIAEFWGFPTGCNELTRAQLQAILTVIFYPHRYGYTRGQYPSPKRNL